jgi:hypothetical protein
MIRLLLQLYPRHWRAEYGQELESILKERPLRASTIANVLWNALRQRIRSAEPRVFSATLVCSIAAAGYVAIAIRPTWAFFLYAWVNPLQLLFVILAAAWTIRRGRSIIEAAWSALYTSVAAGLVTLLFCCARALGWIHPAPFCDPEATATFVAGCGMTTFFFKSSMVPPLFTQMLILAGVVLATALIGALLGTLAGRALRLFQRV